MTCIHRLNGVDLLPILSRWLVLSHSPPSPKLLSHPAMFSPLPFAVSPELQPAVGVATELRAFAVCTLGQLCLPVAGVTVGLESSDWRGI